ncbi:Gp19/Gp15/Gp42 family protein [Amycolatopsis minnesotensis]|uniref:Gp19/Gp15/Gp42-like protein n=1 Tax=Amycolatopsis minnesotensis TaxID=337894 RepID=A0ABN2Q0C5_9PSEU
MALATVGDVSARLGRDLSPDEATQVSTLLGDAELLIKTRIPDLLARVAAGTIDSAVVIMIEANMVARVVRNPDGYVQETDGNYSYQVSTAVASGRLSVLDDEWSWLGITRGVFLLVPKVNIPWRDQTEPRWWT